MYIIYSDYANNVNKSERNEFECRSKLTDFFAMDGKEKIILIIFFIEANMLRHVAFPFQIISS